MSSLNVRVNAVTISSTPATLSPLRDVAWLRCVDSATSNDRPLSPDVKNQFNFHFPPTTSLHWLKTFEDKENKQNYHGPFNWRPGSPLLGGNCQLLLQLTASFN